MVLKFVVFVCLVAITIEAVCGAPYIPKTEQELTKSFIDFLKQDKELSAVLDKANLGDGAIFERQKRQAEGETMSDEDAENAKPSSEGFFDRATKFVMEVLQRFLKWINTDN